MFQTEVSMPEVSHIHRHSERSVPDEAASILVAGLVAHVGFNDGDEPQVIPFLYHYDPHIPDRLYLHGAVANHTLRLLTSGAPVCVTVTLIDGLVYSRSAPNHSANYRSVVCSGRGQLVSSDEEKEQMFTAMIGRYFAGRERGRDYTASTLKDLRTTTVVAVQIERWGAKARRGGPLGPLDADPDAAGTCGVVEQGGASNE